MRISIITVCYNSENTIKDTIESVLSQTYNDFEYIIVDGNSSDSTLDIISKYTDPRIKVLSENDNGLYDAMNKGISLCTGDIIATINADDRLADNTIFQTVINNMNDKTDIIYGDIKYFNNDFSKVIRNYISGYKKNDAWCPAHPSMYIKKDVFKQVGHYNIRYKIAADYDFMVRCNKININYKYIKKYFVDMRYGGASNGTIGYLRNFAECLDILKTNKVSFPFSRTICRSVRAMIQIIRG